MTSRRYPCLEEKINLIKEKESGLSQRQLSECFRISMGAASNTLKRKSIEKEIDFRLFQKCACDTNLELFKMTNYFFLSCDQINKFIFKEHLSIKRRIRKVLLEFEKVSSHNPLLSDHPVYLNIFEKSHRCSH